MEPSMKRAMVGWGAAALMVVGVAGCGGDSGGGGSVPPPPPTSIAGVITNAAANPANDTSTSTSSAFSVLQSAGVPAVVVKGAPVVNFTVFSNGAVKQGLTLTDMSFAIAKLVPGTNGNPNRWQSYVSRVEKTTGANNVGSGPNGTPVLPEALQATTDPKPAAQANQLVYNPDGYYTYTFSTNITDPANTFGVVFEPGLTHRIAIQLSYKNSAGEVIRVNPYYDVTFDANGNSVAVTDPAKTQVIAVVSSCNGCHDKLALHGGGRVDVQFCVMCHNDGTTDANSGNVLRMATMTHKIHAGRFLSSQPGGQDYRIWGYQSVEHDYADIGYPQDLRNCVKCHNESDPKVTPQGGYWRTNPSKEACLTCHGSAPGSGFDKTHKDFAIALVGPNAKPLDLPNSECAQCHRAGTAVSAERVHWNQNEENAAKYKVTIDSAQFDPAARKVTVRYYVANPTDKDAKWNLVTPDCTGSGATLSCGSNTQFGNLRFLLAYPNMVGQPLAVTEFTSYNNGGSSAAAYLYKGANDGSNVYTVDIPLPADSATAVAQGTARIASVGQIKEPKLQVQTTQDPRPPVQPTVLVNVLAQNTSADVALSGALNPRRTIVSNEKCNVCHGSLGATSGSNTLSEAFHGGARNTVQACAVCHDQNRVSSTVMTSGAALGENYAFKRMIHGIHGNSRREFPFTHGNNVIGAFTKAGILTLDGLIAASSSSTVSAPAGTLFQPWSTGTVVPAGTALGASGSPVENYAAEVGYPSIGLDCNGCHVNNSWQQDPNPVGSVVAKPIDPATNKAGTDPLQWRVITPKAASCTACHDSRKAINHVVGVGGAAFGEATQAQSFQTQESCVDCHRVGLPQGVDIVHSRK
jgi:OmcA/MtrC family decaheme c-type cytochrome